MYVTEALFIFLEIFLPLFLFFTLNNFDDSVFKFTDSVIAILMLSPSTGLFFFAEIFYLFIHQKHIFLDILVHVMIFALKSLSVNFYISGWASIDILFSSEWITFSCFFFVK